MLEYDEIRAPVENLILFITDNIFKKKESDIEEQSNEDTENDLDSPTTKKEQFENIKNLNINDYDSYNNSSKRSGRRGSRDNTKSKTSNGSGSRRLLDAPEEDPNNFPFSPAIYGGIGPSSPVSEML